MKQAHDEIDEFNAKVEQQKNLSKNGMKNILKKELELEVQKMQKATEEFLEEVEKVEKESSALLYQRHKSMKNRQRI